MITFETKKAAPPSGRDVAPPPPAEESAWRVLPLGGLFDLLYLDASGRTTTRRVRAIEAKVGPGKLLLGGIDQALGEYRGFRADRILALSDTETGERVERNVLDWLLLRAEREAKARRRRAAAA